MDICLMRFYCSVCNKAITLYVKCNYHRYYVEDIGYVTDIYTPYGKYDSLDQIVMWLDGIYMIGNSPPIKDGKKCQYCRKFIQLDSFS